MMSASSPFRKVQSGKMSPMGPGSGALNLSRVIEEGVSSNSEIRDSRTDAVDFEIVETGCRQEYQEPSPQELGSDSERRSPYTSK